jgi:hypothetical protein
LASARQSIAQRCSRRGTPAVQRSLPSLQRINEVLEAEPDVKSPEEGLRLAWLRGEVT